MSDCDRGAGYAPDRDKSVANGESIASQLDRVADVYDVDVDEARRWALDVGVGELLGRYEMMEDEAQVYADDGRHVVVSGDAADDEDDVEDLPDWEDYTEAEI
jgi:hypothetical protein